MKLSRTQLATYLIGNPGAKSVRQVASYLLANGRSKEVDSLIREVEAQLAKRGRTVARIGSARKLDVDEQRQLVGMVKQTFNAQSVEVINEVDPSLLGGVVVRTPGTEVDVSIRGKLNRLKRV